MPALGSTKHNKKTTDMTNTKQCYKATQRTKSSRITALEIPIKLMFFFFFFVSSFFSFTRESVHSCSIDFVHWPVHLRDYRNNYIFIKKKNECVCVLDKGSDSVKMAGNIFEIVNTSLIKDIAGVFNLSAKRRIQESSVETTSYEDIYP